MRLVSWRIRDSFSVSNGSSACLSVSRCSKKPTKSRGSGLQATTSTQTSNTVSVTRTQPTRQVWFHVNAYDDIEEERFIYESVPDDHDDETPLHLTRNEIKIMRKEATELASKNALQRKDYVESIESLLNSPIVRRSQKTGEVKKENARCTIQALPDLRGLESKVSLTLLRYKQWANQSVINRQDTLRRERGENVEDILRKWCEQVNKCTLDLALLLAQVDELEARKIYSASERVNDCPL